MDQTHIRLGRSCRVEPIEEVIDDWCIGYARYDDSREFHVMFSFYLNGKHYALPMHKDMVENYCARIKRSAENARRKEAELGKDPEQKDNT